jgi:hypothetical protein
LHPRYSGARQLPSQQRPLLLPPVLSPQLPAHSQVQALWLPARQALPLQAARLWPQLYLPRPQRQRPALLRSQRKEQVRRPVLAFLP